MRITGYGGTILAVQDTTGVNYNTHLKTEGIGYISDKTRGASIHSCLAVTCDGLVLGVLDQSGYNRKEPKKPYTIKEAADCLGRPGGPKRAPSDGPPGVKTIWIGLMKLHILLAYREYLA